VELINGEIYQMSPIKSLHAGTVNLLTAFLSQFNQSFIISIQNPVVIDQYSESEPDIALLKTRADFYTESNPTPKEILWIIEVSDTTLRYDQTVKKELYAQANIPAYWIINLVDYSIEVYQEPKEDSYQQKERYVLGDQVFLPLIHKKVEVNQFLIKV
ncbi:MAG: Uma2 family endonuclease, partial [Bacteroidota bacterium]